MKKIIGFAVLCLAGVAGTAVYMLLPRSPDTPAVSEGSLGPTRLRPEPGASPNAGRERESQPPAQLTGAPPSADPAGDPKRVRTVIIRPDGSVLDPPPEPVRKN